MSLRKVRFEVGEKAGPFITQTLKRGEPGTLRDTRIPSRRNALREHSSEEKHSKNSTRKIGKAAAWRRCRLTIRMDESGKRDKTLKSGESTWYGHSEYAGSLEYFRIDAKCAQQTMMIAEHRMMRYVNAND